MGRKREKTGLEQDVGRKLRNLLYTKAGPRARVAQRERGRKIARKKKSGKTMDPKALVEKRIYRRGGNSGVFPSSEEA